MQIQLTVEVTDNQVYGLKYAYQRYTEAIETANTNLPKDAEPEQPLSFEAFLSPEIARWCQSYYDQLGREENEKLAQKFAQLTREQKAKLLSDFAVEEVLKPAK